MAFSAQQQRLHSRKLTLHFTFFPPYQWNNKCDSEVSMQTQSHVSSCIHETRLPLVTCPSAQWSQPSQVTSENVQRPALKTVLRRSYRKRIQKYTTSFQGVHTGSYFWHNRVEKWSSDKRHHLQLQCAETRAGNWTDVKLPAFCEPTLRNQFAHFDCAWFNYCGTIGF